jgi:hypothetical protein
MLMLGFLICCLIGWLAFSLLSNGLVRFAMDEQSILLVSDLHLDTLGHDRSNA